MVGIKLTKRQRALLSAHAASVGKSVKDVLMECGVAAKLRELEASPAAVCPTCGRPLQG